ncbi:MAG: hypothetical protein IMZ66_05380, partial [Planctomycetes bacterium]|nr:hypothetical protein [Planctomycetota bacterium]
MMLAIAETRLLFYKEGLAMTGGMVALVGAIVFWALLVHWLVRAKAW